MITDTQQNDYIDVEYKNNNNDIIDKISAYLIMYENLRYNVSAKTPTHIVCHKLYSIYNIIKHFNIGCASVIVDKNIKSSEDFTNKYLGRETNFWKRLYKYDINNMINDNPQDLMLSYIKDTKDTKYKRYLRNMFGSCYCPVGSLVYNFKYNDPNNRFIINIYPVTTTIIIKNPLTNEAQLILKNKNNYLYWNKIKERAESILNDDYQLLQEIIYCITDGYQASSIPSMTLDYFNTHFYRDEYEYIENYYKNNSNVYSGYNFNDMNILLKCLDPYILENIILRSNIDNDNRKLIFDKYFTVVIHATIAKIIDSYERDHEYTYITKIQLPKCINVMKKYFPNTIDTLNDDERNKIKKYLSKYHCVEDIDVFNDEVLDTF